VSIETTLARAEERAARDRWDDHLRGCPPCSRWNSRQRGQMGCSAGRDLRAGYKASQAALKASRELDRQPIGMEPLF
jgi:hypothetical protein